MLKKTLTTVALLLVIAAPVFAGDKADEPNLILTSLKSLGALLLILALIVLAAWAAKKYLHLIPQGGTKGDGIKIISVRALGPKRSVHLIEVEGNKILIGSSEGGVALLKEFPDSG